MVLAAGSISYSGLGVRRSENTCGKTLSPSKLRKAPAFVDLPIPPTRVFPFPKGHLLDGEHVRLVSNHVETPAQYNVESVWPDGSVQWLWVDFNASLGPHEETTYQLEYGKDVKPGIVPHAWTVSESADAIQVGDMRFSKTGAPLLLSVKYRDEAIGQGQNGFAITDSAGALHDASNAESLKFELTRSGPLYVVFRYSGRMSIDGQDSFLFSLTIELPRSKSWWKGIVTLEDSSGRVRALSMRTPMALGSFPWIWDFGTGSWTYGTFHSRADSVTLTQIVKFPNGSQWQIRSGEKGHEQLYEATGGRRPPVAEGWGHLQNQKEAIAFSVGEFGRQEGTYTFRLDGEGQTSFSFAPARPLTHHHFTIYQHFVTAPAAIGAVTSPVSMLNPLVVLLEREQYLRSGLPSPPDTAASAR